MNTYAIVKNLSKDLSKPTPWQELFRYRETDDIRQTDTASAEQIDTVYVKGRNVLLEEVRRPRVAIIGTRDMTPYGRDVTSSIVCALAKNPARPVIISGLALGVETQALNAALEQGLPTVAIIANGTDDDIYPSHNTELGKKILEKGGCILSPFPQMTMPTAWNFITKNKVLATVSDLIIIPETKVRGGAIISARYADKTGAVVAAVPGRLNDETSRGCNRLIGTGTAHALYDISLLENPSYLRNLNIMFKQD